MCQPTVVLALKFVVCISTEKIIDACVKKLSFMKICQLKPKILRIDQFVSSMVKPIETAKPSPLRMTQTCRVIAPWDTVPPSSHPPFRNHSESKTVMIVTQGDGLFWAKANSIPLYLSILLAKSPSPWVTNPTVFRRWRVVGYSEICRRLPTLLSQYSENSQPDR